MRIVYHANMNADQIINIISGIIIPAIAIIVIPFIANSGISKFMNKLGLQNHYSKESALEDFLSDNSFTVNRVTIYMKNKDGKTGRVLISDISAINDSKLPYTKLSQGMDGITLYINMIDDKVVPFLDENNNYNLTYIPYSEIESIDYKIVSKK